MKTSRPSVPPAQQAADIPVHVLPARWSPEAQQALDAFLAGQTGHPVQISARDLRRVDCLMVQQLVAAARAWVARGTELAITDRDPAFDRALSLIGVTPETLRGLA